MRETTFQPPAAMIPRIAPTERDGPNGAPLRGVVHDATARYMGGVAGHAGLFSTADDLARFCEMMLHKGELDGTRLFSVLTVEKFTTPQGPVDQPILRGLGWDIDSPFSGNRGDLFPIGSYGHTGFTGTSIWIDPVSDTYVILLANSVHPFRRPGIIGLRGKVATITAAALGVDASTGMKKDEDPNVRAVAVRQMASVAVVQSGTVLVDSSTLSSVDSLGADFVFFTSREHPIARLSDVTDPGTQFAVAEFSQRTMALRRLLWGGSDSAAAAAPPQGYTGTGVEFGAHGTLRPLGDTYQSGGGTTIMGIGADAWPTLFQQHPQLRLFVATRGAPGIYSITATGGGVEVRFVASP
jgi:hypothetical protein